MTTPAWWQALSGLDDDALAALGNRGLVRRAARAVAAGDVTVESSTADAVVVRVAGTPPATVRLLPGGPAAARCACPVAGVCVHIITACVWTRGFVPGSAVSDGAGEVTGDPLADLLAWSPEEVMRAVGVAAVRRVAREVPSDATAQGRVSGSAVTITWPGSPEVIAVPGAGPTGMIVAGHHSEARQRALMLEAMVRLFAGHGIAWPWPGGLTDEAELQDGQRDAAVAVRRVVEDVVAAGLARASVSAADRLTGVGQRARLEGLPLLARLCAGAARQVAAISRRDDDVAERDALIPLADAWALASALLAADTALPPGLVGAASGAASALGPLVPLSVRWWLAPSGARRLRATFWDTLHHRVEVVDTGRAAGTDPSFTPSWSGPLLWGASAERLCSGVLALEGAEHRDDGTLSPTARTSVSVVGSWGDVDLAALAAALASATTGPDAVGFGRAAPRTRLLMPALLGVGPVRLDEVRQERVWTIRTSTGIEVLRFGAGDVEAETVRGLLERGMRIRGIVVDGDRPDAVFVESKTGLTLESLTLTLPRWTPRARTKPPARPKAARPHEPAPNAVERVCGAVLDGAEAAAATGRTTLSPRQAESVAQASRTAADLGLGTIEAAARALLADPSPASVLRAAIVAQRALRLAR